MKIPCVSKQKGDYLKGEQAVEVEKMKPYLRELLCDFTNRVGGDFLGNYGWGNDDVTLMLIEHLRPEELKLAAKQVRANERNNEESNLKVEIDYAIEVKNSVVSE